MSMADLEQSQSMLFELPPPRPVARVRNKLQSPPDWDSMFEGEKLVMDEDDEVELRIRAVVKNPPYVDTKRNKAGHKIGPRTAVQYLQPIGEPEILTVERKAQ